MSVFFLDECHLLWGDVCGYIWGKSNRRIEVPIVNERQKQTYYGALDYFNHEFLTQAYPRANSEHTISFLDYLQAPGIIRCLKKYYNNRNERVGEKK